MSALRVGRTTAKIRECKGRLLSSKSPVRWGLLGILLASFLFCIEISVSCYSLYLSLASGGVVVSVGWMDTLAFVLFVLFGIVGIGGVILLGIIAIKWLISPDTGGHGDAHRIEDRLEHIETNIINAIEGSRKHPDRARKRK